MKNRQKRKEMLLMGLAVCLLVALDQATKRLAVHYLKDRPPVPLIKGVFELQYLENRGMAFGLQQGGRWIFVAVTAALLVILPYIYYKIPSVRRFLYLRIALVFFLAGAAGNFIDGLFYGYVVDFFYFVLIDFPIFNVADVYVTLVMAASVYLLMFYYQEDDFEWIFRKKKGGSV